MPIKTHPDTAEIIKAKLEDLLAGSRLNHDKLDGLADDDHAQYHNDTRGDVRYHTKSEFIAATSGVADAGKPVKLNTSGLIDDSMISLSAEDHGTLSGLADDDHAQYHNDTRGDVRYNAKTGFENRTDSTLSWSDATPDRTLTITGTFNIFLAGTKTAKTTESKQIENTTGIHYIYYNASGVLSESTVWPGFDVVLVAFVYWNASTSKGLCSDERHGYLMSSQTHAYLHETVGVRYGGGLAGTFADATFSVGAGSIWDEDLEIEIGDETTCRVLYRSGADWTWTTAQAEYYSGAAGSLNYDNAGSLDPVGANNYVAAWIFATNDISTPVVALVGQRTDTTIANARANNKYESLSFGTLPYKEMKLLYRVILRNDATPYEETQDLRNISNLPAGTYVATAHNVLTGLTTGDDHTQYLDNTRGDARYFHQSSFVDTSAGAGDAGKPVKLNTSGLIDSSMISVAFEHGGYLDYQSESPKEAVDTSAIEKLYYRAKKSSKINLYNTSKSAWEALSFSETEISLASVESGKNYDIHAYDNSGTLAFELAEWVGDNQKTSPYFDISGDEGFYPMEYAILEYDSKLWIIGGDEGSGHLASVWNSTDDGVTWSLVTAAAAFGDIAGHTALVYDNKMWVIGGDDESSYLDKVYYSTDGATWTLATDTAAFSERAYHSSVVYDSKMWVIGGELHDGTKLNSVYYSTDGITWTQATAAAAFSARYGHASVVYDSKMWVLGGYDGSNKNDVYYSTDGITWTQATAAAAWGAMKSFAAVAFDSKIVVLGVGTDTKQVWYSVDGVDFLQADSLPIATNFFNAIATASGKLLYHDSNVIRASESLFYYIFQDGIEVKSSDKSRLFVGSVRGSDAGKTSCSITKFFLWNKYNQQALVRLYFVSGSHTYASTTPRFFNNDDTKSVEVLCGETTPLVFSSLISSYINNSSYEHYFSICFDPNSAVETSRFVRSKITTLEQRHGVYIVEKLGYVKARTIEYTSNASGELYSNYLKLTVEYNA